MGELFKKILKLLAILGTIYLGFKLTQKVRDGQLKMKLEFDDEPPVTEEKKMMMKYVPTPKPLVVKQMPLVVSTLNDRQKVLLELIRSKKALDMSAIEANIKGVTTRTLRRDLASLVDSGQVIKTGKTKSARYVIV